MGAIGMISHPRRYSDLKSLRGIDPNIILLVAFWIGKKKKKIDFSFFLSCCCMIS